VAGFSAGTDAEESSLGEAFVRPRFFTASTSSLLADKRGLLGSHDFEF
jgi:hypothetical protein